MEITNPVLFEVLAERRGRRLARARRLVRRAFARPFAFRGVPDAGSSRRPFPRVGFGAPRRSSRAAATARGERLGALAILGALALALWV